MSISDPAVVCLSGGMDSTSLLLHLLAQGRQVFGVSFDYGQKHKFELLRLQDNLAYLGSAGHSVEWKLVDLSSLTPLLHSALTDGDWDVPEGHYESENMKQTVVPNRNAIFASIAYAHALSISKRQECNVILSLGVHAGDHAIYPDCTPEFYRQLIGAFREGNWDSDSIELYLPYIELDKARILEDAQKSASLLSLDFETLFRNTLTSYSPDDLGRSSGLTGSDVERILAFDQLELEDPIDYRRPWNEVVADAKRIESEFRSQNQVTD